MANSSLKYKIYKPCRLCLDPKVETFDLFDNSVNSERLEIITAIEKIFSFTITPTERLTSICAKCMQLTKKFSDFFTLVITAQTFLSSYAADYKGTFTYRPPIIEHSDNFKETISEDGVIYNIQGFPISIDVKEESLNQSQSETDLADNLEEDILNNSAVDEQIDVKLEFCEEKIGTFMDDSLKSDQLNVEIVDNLILKKDSDDINNHEILSTSHDTSIANLEEPIQIFLRESNDLTAVTNESEDSEQGDSDEREVTMFAEPVKLFENGTLIVTGDKLDYIISKFHKFQCQLCLHKPEFKRLFDMFKHYETEHGTKGYITCCDKRFHSRSNFIYHIARHMQSDAFRCNICNRDFTRRAGLRAHLLRHLPESERPYKCNQCDRRYSSNNSLILHKDTHLPVEQRRYYKSLQDKLLAKDLESEQSGKDFLCPKCGHGFITEGGLKHHLYTHDQDGQNSVQCKQCGIILKTPANLRAHQKIHNGKRFQCNECSFVTCVKGRLPTHMKIKHTDVKPHECKFCDKRFKVKSCLNAHLAQHTGEKKYSCTYCPRTFVSSGNRCTHQKKMHTELYARDIKKKQEEKLKNMNSRNKESAMETPVDTQYVHEEIKKFNF